jgi:hypothetical protein
MSNEVKEEVNNEGFDDSNERDDDESPAAYDANVNEDDEWIFEDAEGNFDPSKFWQPISTGEMQLRSASAAPPVYRDLRGESIIDDEKL